MKVLFALVALLAVSSAFQFDQSSMNMAVCIAQFPSYYVKIQSMITSNNFTNLSGLYNDIKSGLSHCGIELPTGYYYPQDQVKCIQDVVQIGTLVPKIKDDLQNFNLTALAQDISQLYALVQQALVDCGNSTKLTTQQAQNISTALDCLDTISMAIKSIVSKTSVDHFSIQSLVKVFPELSNFLTTFENKCNVNLNFQVQDQAQCLSDLQTIYTIATKLKTDLSNFDIAAIAADISSLYEAVQQALIDCQQSKKKLMAAQEDLEEESDDEFSFLSEIDFDDMSDFVASFYESFEAFQETASEKCLAKIYKITDAFDALQDMEEFDFLTLATSLKQVFYHAQEAIESCDEDLENDDVEVEATIETPKLQMSLTELGSNIMGYFGQSSTTVGDKDTCLQDIQQIGAIAQKLQKDIKNFNIAALAVDIAQLYTLVEKALEDCNSSEVAAQLNNIVDMVMGEVKGMVKDQAACLQDIVNIGQLAIKIKTDLSNFDISALAQDFAQLTALVQQAMTDCQQSF